MNIIVISDLYQLGDTAVECNIARYGHTPFLCRRKLCIDFFFYLNAFWISVAEPSMWS